MPTALVIEDDVSSVNVLAHVLERRGYRVLTSTEADEAARICGDVKIDVVVCDLILRAAYSGTDVARRLREHCSDVPVLFVSGTPLEGWSSHDFSNVEALLPGRVEFLMKPFTAEALAEAVARLMASGWSESGIRTALEGAKRMRHGAA